MNRPKLERASNASDEPAPRAGQISLAQAAALLTCSERWVRDLAAKGYFPKPEKGMVRLAPTVQGFIAFLRDEERRSSKSAAASRVQDARAREIELRTAQAEGRLVEMETVENTVAEILGIFRSELDALPAAITRDLALRATIQTNVADLLARCRKRFEAASADLRDGRDPDAHAAATAG